MRLSYKTYPVWRFVESPSQILHMEIDTAVSDDVGSTYKKLLEHMEGMRQVFSQIKDKFYVTEAFEEAVNKALPKIMNDYTYLDPQASCGVFLTKGGMTVYLTNPGDSNLKLLLYGFTREAHTCFAVVTHDGRVGGSYKILNENNVLVQRTDLMTEWCNSMMVFLYFLKNCEVESKLLKPNEKARTTGGGRHAEKHFNESKTNVTILDCTWFTELIRVSGSKVTAHYRWQPYKKNGEWKKKLIAIAEYEKGPYIRRAKKDIYDEDKTAD